MNAESQESTFAYDVFISYSRKDIVFARALQKALENYSSPRDLIVSQHRLVVFRDEDDFTGAEYNQSLREHLEKSAKMVVICSPNARASEYVNDEIRQFANLRAPKILFRSFFRAFQIAKPTNRNTRNRRLFRGVCGMLYRYLSQLVFSI